MRYYIENVSKYELQFASYQLGKDRGCVVCGLERRESGVSTWVPNYEHLYKYYVISR